MFRNISGLDWHVTSQHETVTDRAGGQGQTRTPSDAASDDYATEELLRDIVDTMKMQVDSRKRLEEEQDSLNERMGALEARVSSLTESDIVVALDDKDHEPKGWWPNSPS